MWLLSWACVLIVAQGRFFIRVLRKLQKVCMSIGLALCMFEMNLIAPNQPLHTW